MRKESKGKTEWDAGDRLEVHGGDKVFPGLQKWDNKKKVSIF